MLCFLPILARSWLLADIWATMRFVRIVECKLSSIIVSLVCLPTEDRWRDWAMNVADSLRTKYFERHRRTEIDMIDEIALPEHTAAPDVSAQNEEITAIRKQSSAPLVTSRQFHMEMPPFRSTAIAEFTRTPPLLSWDFTMLFLCGEADSFFPRRVPWWHRSRGVADPAIVLQDKDHRRLRFAFYLLLSPEWRRIICPSWFKGIQAT